MSVSRREFCKGLVTKATKFKAPSTLDESSSNRDCIWLNLNEWNPFLLRQFALLSRIIMNFGFKKIIIMLREDSNLNDISNQLHHYLFKDPFFISHSRVMHPSSDVLLHVIEQRYLRLHAHHILNVFSDSPSDLHKLQITIIHHHSVAPKALQNASIHPFRFTHYHLEHIESLSFQEQLSIIDAVRGNLKHNIADGTNHDDNNNDDKYWYHIFHLPLKGTPSISRDRLSTMTLITFILYTHRLRITSTDTMHPIKSIKSTECIINDNESKENDDSNHSSFSVDSDCIPVLYAWKTPYNLGSVFHLCYILGVPLVIHLYLFDAAKLNLYRNKQWMDRMAEYCGQSVQEMNNMVDIVPITKEGEAINAMKERLNKIQKKESNECNINSNVKRRKVTVLVIPQDIFLKVLEMDEERSLVIMETVNFGRNSPPISLREMMTEHNKNGKGMMKKCYGVVGRENYGIKPKYLYEMYRICQSQSNPKQCKVVYVNTSKEMVSLNASTAMSLLMWASYCLSHK